MTNENVASETEKINDKSSESGTLAGSARLLRRETQASGAAQAFPLLLPLICSASETTFQSVIVGIDVESALLNKLRLIGL